MNDGNHLAHVLEECTWQDLQTKCDMKDNVDNMDKASPDSHV